MLTRAEAIAEFKGERVVPDRLPIARRAVYLAYAGEMLHLYHEGAGSTRGELHRSVSEVLREEPDCPAARVAAFAKLLDDAAVFDGARGGKAARLRGQIYEAAAAHHPLVECPAGGGDLFAGPPAANVREQVARAVGQAGWAEVDAVLFADVIEFHRLVSFAGYPDAAALLDRYDVAQAQAALYGAVGMRVWVERDFRRVLRAAKLAGLLHDIRRVGEGGDEGYEFTFSGPASVLRRTRRYGVAMAKLLPVLLACRGRWRLRAEVEAGRGKSLLLELDENCGLRGHLPSGTDYDSGVEAGFAAAWAKGERQGWHLEREAEVLHDGQRTFVPDFVLRHAVTGRRVLLEIIGFWTPEYLAEKRRTLAHFADRPILLAVRAGAAGTLASAQGETVIYKTVLRPADVLACLERRTPDATTSSSHG